MRFSSRSGIIFSIVALICFAICVKAQTTPATERSDGFYCYTCGMEGIDPEKDETGSYGNYDREWIKNDPNKKIYKMYNHSCDIMHNMRRESDSRRNDDKIWLRKCPSGVRSCWWAQGTFKQQRPVFRGCATSKYKHDEGCDRELEAVQIKEGQKSQDVEVMLCFCNEDKCNEKISGASSVSNKIILTILFGLVSILFK